MLGFSLSWCVPDFSSHEILTVEKAEQIVVEMASLAELKERLTESSFVVKAFLKRTVFLESIAGRSIPLYSTHSLYSLDMQFMWAYIKYRELDLFFNSFESQYSELYCEVVGKVLAEYPGYAQFLIEQDRSERKWIDASSAGNAK